MTDKREVLDYLRNQQKAAEIEAKMNGVNIWVLLGAIAVVGWQLTNTLADGLWEDRELMARTVFSAVALYMLSLFLESSSEHRDEIRYSRANFRETESPFLVLLMGLLMTLPPIALWTLGGKGIGIIVIGLFGTAFIVISSIEILEPVFTTPQKEDALPKPEFSKSRRAQIVTTLIIGALLLISIGEQLFHFFRTSPEIPIDTIKAMMLLAVFYILILTTLVRKLRNNSIAWTYEMETDLIIGAITPEVAIRRIENHRLGPRLHDVVNRFLDGLDHRFSEIDSKLVECTEKIKAAKEVPAQYPAERAARIQAATEAVEIAINSLAADCDALRNYLLKIEQMPRGRRKLDLEPVLSSLKARHEAYDERLRTAKLQLKQFLI